MFRDPESGIDFFMWSIGSQPGHSDIMEFTRESSECGINNKNQRLDIKEGHAYYITVKVKVSIQLFIARNRIKEWMIKTQLLLMILYEHMLRILKE